MDTQELYNYLHENFEYKDGKLFFIKQVGIRGQIGKQAGSKHKKGYIDIQIKKKCYKAHRLIFLYHRGYLPEFIDHINRIRDDNRIENLREIDQGDNQRNSKKYNNRTQIYKGVYYNKGNKKWFSVVQINKKRHYLGLHKTPELAYQAYCEFVKANLPIYCLE
jgi:hypothetical protein